MAGRSLDVWADNPAAEVTWVDDASHFVPCDRPDAVLRLLVRPAPA